MLVHFSTDIEGAVTDQWPELDQLALLAICKRWGSHSYRITDSNSPLTESLARQMSENIGSVDSREDFIVLIDLAYSIVGRKLHDGFQMQAIRVRRNINMRELEGRGYSPCR